MEKQKLGQEPAFPRTAKISEKSEKSEYSNKPQQGMSKRFYAACAAMQGICADTNVKLDENGCKKVAEMAYRVADELLKQENV